MEQHPVPQNIATFEFKLFGNLTIRQFVTLAIPMTIATLIFFSPLPVIFRLPTSFIIGVIGLVVSLLPVNGRPFDKWLVSFIKAITSPTQRIWVKEKRIPDFLRVVTSPPPVEEKIPESITAQSRERLREYLRSLPKEAASPLDKREELAMRRLNMDIKGVEEGKLPPPIIWSTHDKGVILEPKSYPKLELGAEYKPNIITTPEPTQPETLQAQIKPQPKAQAPIVANHAKPYMLPGIVHKLKQPFHHMQEHPTPVSHIASETNFAMDNIIPIQTPNRQLRLIAGVGKTRVRKLHFAPPLGFDLSKLPIRGEKRFEISDELKRRYEQSEKFIDAAFAASPTPISSEAIPQIPKVITQPPQPTPIFVPHPKPMPKMTFIPKNKPTLQKPANVKAKEQKREEIDSLSHIIAAQTPKNTKEAQTIKRAQLIPLTDKPNVLSGLITDSVGNSIEAAVLIVRDTNGIPIRALKTNKLGQFLSATPLSNGTYTIEIESQKGHFQPLHLEVLGKIMEPIEIKSVN